MSEFSELVKLGKIHNDVTVIGNYIHSIEKDKKGNLIYKPVAELIKVKKLIENIDTKEISYELFFMSYGRMKSIIVGKEEVSVRSKLLGLSKYGLDVNEMNYKFVMKHIRNEMMNLDVELIHEKIGFEEGERPYFKKYKTIGYEHESTYAGRLLIKPKGSEDKWTKLVKSEVIGNKYLEFSLVLGFSAATVGFVGEVINIESLFVHIFAESTQGKTTAAQLAVSAFGSPGLREQGLVMDWNSTQNAILGTIAGNKGVPVVLDEASMLSKKDFTGLVYMLTSGRDKKRMNKNLEVKAPETWNTTVISTGEHSILSKCNENTGLRVRMLEFGNNQWTDSAGQAEKIKHVVTNNYGFAGIKYIEKLLSIGKTEVIDKIYVWKEKLDKELKESPFKQRIATKLALILATAEIVNEALEIKLNIENIKDIIVENENSNEEDKDLPSKAYEYLLQVLAENNKHLKEDYRGGMYGDLDSTPNTLWGKVEKKNSKTYAVILTSKFEEIMKNGGFENPKYILQVWRDRGLLDHEKGKLYRKRIIDDKLKSSVPTYVVEVGTAIGTTLESSNRKAKKRTLKNCNSNVSDIFED